ncbi:MAG: zinc ribbon domain-containing protein [Candidatus Hodarchaeaceae archaeon]|nr:zinc ribbon domain-containing protein [Candidatus Hodarchaeaceae archaeon]
MIRCGKCGAENADGATICKGCGQVIRRPRRWDKLGISRERPRRHPVGVGILTIVTGGLLVLITLLTGMSYIWTLVIGTLLMCHGIILIVGWLIYGHLGSWYLHRRGQDEEEESGANK